eukprot:TRINITY_DN63_c0_g1_i1.p1 TRINITY_DN63_c0_g1~~TRINITY_DN63_c0_g1_i1.p1  ORF type:complete len:250 (+),score=42.07 TRINITY_DN63_c0_g1_i1:120-869(+)
MLPLARGRGGGLGGFTIPEYLRRMLSFPQMDLEFSSWQMLQLCYSPTKTYRTTIWHKQTKNQWARDDPAFVAILIYLLIVSSLAFCLCFEYTSFLSIVKTIGWTVFVDFLAVGLLISSICWLVSNAYLRIPGGLHNVEQKVEYLYSFDIHCNSYFPLVLLLYVVQYFFVLFLTQSGILYTFLSNTLYLFALSYYFYVTFLGYNSLPFLQNSVCFLYPVSLLVLGYFVSLMLNFNLSIFFMNIYFGVVVD